MLFYNREHSIILRLLGKLLLEQAVGRSENGMESNLDLSFNYDAESNHVGS